MAMQKPHANDTGVKPEDAPRERWTYVGRRFDREDGIGFVYIDATGRELRYARQLTGSVIGGHYILPVVRDGESVTVFRNSWNFDGHLDAEDMQVALWKAADLAATTEQAMHAQEKKASKQDINKMTIGALRKQLSRLPRPQRRALLATVLDILTTTDRGIL